MPRSSAADASLPSSERVRKRAEYLRIQSSGKKLVSPRFLAFVLRSQQSRPRLGVTVSKKVGKAVQRNRVKRLLREAFRQQKQSFPEGTDVVFVARAEAAGASYQQVVHDVQGVCRRLLSGR